jgi:Fur family peroxide stress response transcriptional regulator
VTRFAVRPERPSPPIEPFVERCRAAGIAATPQRLAIFRRLAATDSHPSAEELHAAVRREMPTLSLATVYKTLDTLAAIGAVRPVSRLGARGRWDANLAPHHHLVCIACGAVTDVTEPRLEAAARPAAAVAARHGFEAAGHTVEIFGRCAACRGRKRTGSSPQQEGRASLRRQEDRDTPLRPGGSGVTRRSRPAWCETRLAFGRRSRVGSNPSSTMARYRKPAHVGT